MLEVLPGKVNKSEPLPHILNPNTFWKSQIFKHKNKFIKVLK